jgi:hypothetical protein
VSLEETAHPAAEAYAGTAFGTRGTPAAVFLNPTLGWGVTAVSVSYFRQPVTDLRGVAATAGITWRRVWMAAGLRSFSVPDLLGEELLAQEPTLARLGASQTVVSAGAAIRLPRWSLGAYANAAFGNLLEESSAAQTLDFAVAAFPSRRMELAVATRGLGAWGDDTPLAGRQRGIEAGVSWRALSSTEFCLLGELTGRAKLSGRYEPSASIGAVASLPGRGALRASMVERANPFVTENRWRLGFGLGATVTVGTFDLSVGWSSARDDLSGRLVIGAQVNFKARPAHGERSETRTEC